MGLVDTQGGKYKSSVTTSFLAIDNAPSIENAINDLRAILSRDGAVEHLVYHSSKLGVRPSVDPYIRLTYPATWIKRYLTRGYIDVDPVVREGFSRALPFDWTELTLISESELEFFQDSVQHGVGTAGISIPVQSRYGHRGLFSLSSRLSQDEWEEWWRPRIAELSEIGHHLHKRALERVLSPDIGQLPPRAIECLEWMSRGKTMAETAMILGITDNTVRAYLRTARSKLGTSNTMQATTLAIELGLIRPSERG